MNLVFYYVFNGRFLRQNVSSNLCNIISVVGGVIVEYAICYFDIPNIDAVALNSN